MKIEGSFFILSFLCLVVLQGLVEAAPLGRQVSDSDMILVARAGRERGQERRHDKGPSLGIFSACLGQACSTGGSSRRSFGSGSSDDRDVASRHQSKRRTTPPHNEQGEAQFRGQYHDADTVFSEGEEDFPRQSRDLTEEIRALNLGGIATPQQPHHRSSRRHTHHTNLGYDNPQVYHPHSWMNTVPDYFFEGSDKRFGEGETREGTLEHPVRQDSFIQANEELLKNLSKAKEKSPKGHRSSRRRGEGSSQLAKSISFQGEEEGEASRGGGGAGRRRRNVQFDSQSSFGSQGTSSFNSREDQIQDQQEYRHFSPPAGAGRILEGSEYFQMPDIQFPEGHQKY